MDLWRKAVDFEIPIHDDFKTHFMARRGPLLEGFEKVATNWLTVLSACKPIDDETTKGEYKSFVEEVENFKKWAESELKFLDKLGTKG